MKQDVKGSPGFDCEKEESVAGFFGVDLHPSEDGKIELLQTGLTDHVKDALNIEGEVGSAKTPAQLGEIRKDICREQRKDTWSHPSVIGMI